MTDPDVVLATSSPAADSVPAGPSTALLDAAMLMATTSPAPIARVSSGNVQLVRYVNAACPGGGLVTGDAGGRGTRIARATTAAPMSPASATRPRWARSHPPRRTRVGDL